jgi:hypothetical protein
VGVNAAVVNDVRMTTEANRTLHKAVVRERVSLGNDILTGGASRLQVLLLDRSNFTVGPNARIKVDRFVYDPNRKASSVGVTVSRGAFRFMSGKATHKNPGQSGIRTPTASIGIRGTIVEGVVGADAVRIASRQPGFAGLKVDREKAALILLRGPGPAAQGGETPGAIDIQAGDNSFAITGSGMALFVPGNGEVPLGPFALSDWGSAYLAMLLGSRAIGGSAAFGFDVPSNPLNDFFFDELCTGAGGGVEVDDPNGNPGAVAGGDLPDCGGSRLPPVGI